MPYGVTVLKANIYDDYDSFEDEYVQPIIDIVEKDYDSEDSVSQEYVDGFADGYNQGYQKGSDDGYDEGYEDGWSDCEELYDEGGEW
jgi:flagellar biosynthesis/type III secretory pathway protein FliH